MMVQRSVVVLLVLVSLTECKDGAGKISSRDEVEMVRIPMISGYTKVGDPIYQDFYMDVTWFVVLKLKLKYRQPKRMHTRCQKICCKVLPRNLTPYFFIIFGQWAFHG